jgi:hypothetical protein
MVQLRVNMTGARHRVRSARGYARDSMRRRVPSAGPDLTQVAVEKLHSSFIHGQRFHALPWLRGLDLNQRPLGYEIEAAMTVTL